MCVFVTDGLIECRRRCRPMVIFVYWIERVALSPPERGRRLYSCRVVVVRSRAKGLSVAD